MLKYQQEKIQRQLQQSQPFWMVCFVGLSAMLTYFSMYAYRKPFSVATYESMSDFGALIDYKTLLVIAQVCGYALSKLIGIKLIAEMQPEKRIRTLFLLMLMAQLALVAFALFSPPFRIVAIFCNGLPLGLIWGVVFSYLEGRRVSEALGVILGVSLIFSSGVVKSIGRYLLIEWQVPEFWMPAVVGFLFSPLLMLSVFALSCTPPPTKDDKAMRQARIPMTKAQRWRFFSDYAPGIIMLVLCYVIVTSLREFIDNFAPEIWTALGYDQSSSVYTSTILPVTIVVMLLMYLIMFVRSNLLALQVNMLVVLLGFIIIVISTLALQFAYISGFTWMIFLQMGIYAGFMPFNCMLFDRLVAATPVLGNAGFLIYLADTSGYIGSIGIMLYKAFFDAKMDWVLFVNQSSLIAGIVGIVLILFSLLYFYRQLGLRKLPVNKGGYRWTN